MPPPPTAIEERLTSPNLQSDNASNSEPEIPDRYELYLVQRIARAILKHGRRTRHERLREHRTFKFQLGVFQELLRDLEKVDFDLYTFIIEKLSLDRMARLKFR